MTSLSKNARVAGILYTLFSAVGIVRLIYIPSTLIVDGNPTATTNNIAAHESLFRFGIVSQLLTAAGWIFVTLALYRLLKGVNQALAVLMVILGSLMVTPIFFMNAVNEAAALLFVRGGDFLTVFDKPQRDAFAGLLFPGYEDNVFTYAQPLMMGELAIMLWLMIMGAKPPAAVAATSSSAA